MMRIDGSPVFAPHSRLMIEASERPRLRPARAHGGQGGTAGRVVGLQRIEAVLRGTTRTIRVWQGFAAAEEFTIAEGRELATKIDLALAHRSDDAEAGLWLDDGGVVRPLIVSRRWLVGCLAAIRRALRAHDAAEAMSRPSSCVDVDSEPGSWERHLRHTAAMRGAGADSS